MNFRTCASFNSLIGIPIVLVMISSYVIDLEVVFGEVADESKVVVGLWSSSRYSTWSKNQKMRLGNSKLPH